MNRTIIIQGSSKSNGNTNKVITYLNKDNQFDFIDLKTKDIGYFEYDFKNADDDFLPLMEHIIANYDTILFATPVYWYTMSAVLKTFFDRMSDLLHYKKELGRQLRGKNMAMIANSSDNDLGVHFNIPFVKSANYLGMNYLGDTYAWFNGEEIDEVAKKEIDVFRSLL
jgi:multimeric flavodoxin WrbA